jgi:inorganic phosphate transporter, PiT family
MLIFLFLAVLLLGYSNGSNDTYKGTATLWGSGSLAYRPTLVLALVCTFAGSVCSFFFAAELVKNFSGKGLVPDEITQSADFVLAIALAAGATVLLATKLGFPISTTHSITGALVGAGLVAAGTAVNFGKLGKLFFLPLLLIPVIAIAASTIIYYIFTRIRSAIGITQLNGSCEKDGFIPISLAQNSSGTATQAMQYSGRLFGVDFQWLLDKLHFISAGVLSFSKGLNDTPKLVSLLLLCNFLNIQQSTLILAFIIALGGIINGKRIARTLSYKITPMNHGQGFTANLVSSILMITATAMGLPAAITHISVGSIYGVSLVNKTANNKEISKIGLSWILTLPIAGVLSAIFYFIIHLINQ